MMTDNLWSIVVSKTCFSKPIQKEKFGSQVCTTRLKTTWTKVKMEYKLNIKNSGNFASFCFYGPPCRVGNSRPVWPDWAIFETSLRIFLAKVAPIY